MTIEAVAVPTRSRLFTEQDARAAYDLLTGTVRDEDGNVIEEPTDDQKREPQAVKFGTYPLEQSGDDAANKAERDRVESKARTQGMSLDRLINSLYGRRFSCSVWINPDGDVVGALTPKPPVQRKQDEAKTNGQPAKKRGSRSK